MKKNAYVAAVLNFLLPGLGYIYTGHKRAFYGWALFVLSIAVAVHDYNEISAILQGAETPSTHFVLFIILYPLVFAWDAYRDVVENKAGR